MPSYSIDSIERFEFDMIDQGVYLVLMNVVDIPPHLLLVVSGKVFSISTLGPSVDQDVSKYLQLIHRRKIPSLFVELALPAIFTQEQLLERVRAITSSYDRVNIDGVTCLHPIKDFCSDLYQFEKEGVQLVFDLLDRLKEQQAVKQYYHLNLEPGIKNGAFELQKYTVFDVQEAIHGASTVS